MTIEDLQRDVAKLAEAIQDLAEIIKEYFESCEREEGRSSDYRRRALAVEFQMRDMNNNDSN